MRKRTLVELGLMILLLAVGASVLTTRLRDDPDSPAPQATPTPRMHSLIRMIGPPTQAGNPDSGRPSQPAIPLDVSETPPPQTGIVVVRVLEADGNPPTAEVEVLSLSGFRRQAPEGRLVLEAPDVDLTLYARTVAYPIRQTDPVSVRVATDAYTALDLTLPEALLPVREAGLALLREETFTTIAEVVPDSPAALAGLRPGDALLEINGVSVATLEDERVAAALTGVEGDMLRLRVVIQNKLGELEDHLVDLTL